MNSKAELLPGMFARVIVTTGTPKRNLTLPQAAISYNPYGSIVYSAVEEGKDDKGQPKLIAKQKFVEVGQTRGDQIVVVKGVKEGEQVITSGQLKLKNNSIITVNNSVVPSNDAHPDVVDK
jgi:membrane fusion protein (multidrug efflux system)